MITFLIICVALVLLVTVVVLIETVGLPILIVLIPLLIDIFVAKAIIAAIKGHKKKGEDKD